MATEVKTNCMVVKKIYNRLKVNGYMVYNNTCRCNNKIKLITSNMCKL